MNQEKNTEVEKKWKCKKSKVEKFLNKYEAKKERIIQIYLMRSFASLSLDKENNNVLIAHMDGFKFSVDLTDAQKSLILKLLEKYKKAPIDDILSIDKKGISARIRKSNDEYFLTLKISNNHFDDMLSDDFYDIEIEKQIIYLEQTNVLEHLFEKENVDKYPNIIKKRKTIDFQGKKLQFDFFKNKELKKNDLCFMEIEFENIEEKNNYQLDKDKLDFVEKELFNVSNKKLAMMLIDDKMTKEDIMHYIKDMT